MILSTEQIDKILTTQPFTRQTLAQAFEEAIVAALAEPVTGSDKELIATLKEARKGSGRDLGYALMRLRPSEVDRIIAALSRTAPSAQPTAQASAKSDSAGDTTEFKPRDLVTLNGSQVKALLEATDDGDPETEVTIFSQPEPFKSTDGDDMPAGMYFYWTEYPDEGIVPLSEDVASAAPVAQASAEPVQDKSPQGWDAEFLAKRLARVAKAVGVPMPDMSYEGTAAVAGTILGTIAGKLERAASAASAAPVVPEDKRDAKELKSLAEEIADSLRPFLAEGQKVIWRMPFRWFDDNGVLSNHYDGMGLYSLSIEFDYEIIVNAGEAGIIRRLTVEERDARDAAMPAASKEPTP